MVSKAVLVLGLGVRLSKGLGLGLRFGLGITVMVVWRYYSSKAPSGCNGFDKPDIVSPRILSTQRMPASPAIGKSLSKINDAKELKTQGPGETLRNQEHSWK